jgi:hypothetical protein
MFFYGRLIIILIKEFVEWVKSFVVKERVRPRESSKLISIIELLLLTTEHSIIPKEMDMLEVLLKPLFMIQEEEPLLLKLNSEIHINIRTTFNIS